MDGEFNIKNNIYIDNIIFSMLKFFKFLFLFFSAFTILNVKSTISYHDNKVLNRFMNWLDIHKIESKDDFHLAHIFDNWISNDRYIELINAKNLSYTLGHNQFSGMDSQEFAEYNGFKNNIELFSKGDGFLRGTVPTSGQESIMELSALPTSVDWRTQGKVTTPKDQGQCGSCYTFSTTGALEGAYSIKYGNLMSFSEQQIVDCSTMKNGGPNMGCNGGQIVASETWVGKNGGLCAENSYPYVSGTTQTAGTCQKTCSVVSGSKITKTTSVAPNSDTAMMTAIVQQPVSVAIEADQQSYQLYQQGVFTGSCGTNLDHAVLLVGYGSQSGQDYYILKNSWGTNWGMGGYILLGKGTNPTTGKPYNNGAGQCGVLMQGAYPTL